MTGKISLYEQAPTTSGNKFKELTQWELSLLPGKLTFSRGACVLNVLSLLCLTSLISIFYTHSTKSHWHSKLSPALAVSQRRLNSWGTLLVLGLRWHCCHGAELLQSNVTATWLPHPWQCSRPGWMGLWATWSGGRCPCPGQRGWTTRSLNVTPYPNHSMILWFTCHHPTILK